MSKKEWGNAVWYLLHTLSHKLLPEHSTHASHVQPLLVRIATHLPCPDCSAHATRMLMEMQSKPIRGRADLVEFWREAHNRVNYRTHKPMFSLRECVEKYEQADTRRVVENFRAVMGRIRTGERGLGDGWRRDRVIGALGKYLATHAYMYSR